jgi:hypothetical protein
MILMVVSIYLIFFSLYSLRCNWVKDFKISYYETKLENRGVDIEHIKDISLREILKK